MSLAARSLLTGLVFGVLLALLLQQLTPHIRLPVQTSRGTPASATPLSDSDSMAQVLRQIARKVVRGANASGSNYKSINAAPSSLLQSRPSAFTSSASSLKPSNSFSTTSPTMATSQLTKSFVE